MIPFRYDFQSGYWHGYNKGDIYSVHPTNWELIPHDAHGDEKRLSEQHIKHAYVLKGLVVIPIESPRS